MRKAFHKNIFRTIKKSLGRYMAIFAIIALGVGFFTGLKASKPAMMKTGQEYIEDQNLFDYRLLSTWGFDETETAAIGKLQGVQTAEGAVWEDFIYKDAEGKESCLKALSITEQVNQLTVTAGRMPERPEECVLDASRFPQEMIGQKITISQENTQETRDSFAYEAYTVTGLVRSPIYMNSERGTTTIGNGKVTAFLYIPLEGFSYEYYKEVYVSGDTAEAAFTDTYETEIKNRTDELEDGVSAVVKDRYQQEITDAQGKITDAERELSEKTADADAELAKAKEELDKGEKELAEGKSSLAKAERTLQEKRQELAEGEKQLKKGQQQYQQGQEQYEQGLAEYQTGQAAYEQGAAELEANRGVYEQARAGKEQMEALLPPEALAENEKYLTLAGAVTVFETKERELSQAGEQLAAAKARLDASQRQLTASAAQLEESQAVIADGKRQLAKGEEELAKAKAEIEKNEGTLADGRREYEEGLAKRNTETADAEAKIAEAKEELAKVEEPTVYVLSRSTNVGYASFEGDVNIVEGIAKLFPIFFFLIAALVCSTTMTRMVDDERTQIGTLRALGYSEGSILFKYMLYSGSAAALGATVGYLLGTRMFPAAIWTAYDMLYGFADITMVDNVWLFLLALLVSLLCSAGTTYAACRTELAHAPAQLIRPKAPSAGKRILLERIPILWKHLRFLHKVSARNVFRFKKRMVMMILGIAGCTALVIAGFGIRDSVTNIVNNQYDHIMKYDISATYSKEITEAMQQELEEPFRNQIAESAVLFETSVEAPYKGGVKTVTLMTSNGSDIGRCVDFHLDDTPVELPGKGEILIDRRLAEVLSADIGDEVTLKMGAVESKPLKVTGIFENYTFYYAYVTGETYEEAFGETFEPKTIYYALEEGTDHYQVASYLSDQKDAANISVIADMRSRVENMMQSMNFIVALVIGCAAALAFIVLFNLGNINISERVREIATLKVLGFYPRETGAYVFRESMVLSVMGIVAGVPLGILLHRFVMLQIKIDMVSFEINILPVSYLYSVLAVLGFTVCVDRILRRKIGRIDMAESLKSIE